MRTKILAALVVLVAAGLTTSAAAQADGSDSEGSTVTVDVSNVTAIDLSPNNLAYSNSPGTIATSEDNSGYNGVEIENVGSENITDIYMSTSGDSLNTRPFGSGTASAYDAGNFIQVKPSTEISGINGDSNYHFVERKDFNESNTLSYVTPVDNSGTSPRYGRFRAANESFFWMISEAESSGGTAQFCDGSGNSRLLVGKNPHSPTTTGSVDFSDSSNYNNYTINTVQGSYGMAENVALNTYEGTKNLNFLTWCGDATQQSEDNTTHVIGTRWNPEQRDGSNTYPIVSDSLEKLMDDPGDADELQPGEHFTVFTRVAIPNAVANGQVGSGTLTVNVETTYDSG